MKKIIYLILVSPFLNFAQSSEKVTSTSEKTDVTKIDSKLIAIENQFSNAAVVAYQNQSEKLITDFYNYVNLYANSEITSELTQEIDKGIISLYLDSNIQIKNIFNEKAETIFLKDFIKKCKENKTVITISNFNQNFTSAHYFTLNYSIKASINNEVKNWDITQRVYFFPSEKQFGSKSKNVWQLKLGEM